MALKREGAVFLLGITVLAVIIALLFLPSAGEEELANLAVRFFGLYGYLFLSVTTLITPFLREVTQAFGRPFLKVHHSFSILGVVFITLHPVFNAIERARYSLFRALENSPKKETENMPCIVRVYSLLESTRM
jgi:predicted ferric reductase